MKILFLDIDGVINSLSTPVIGDGDDMVIADKECVDLINRLVERTGVNVVLSSSWRYMQEWRQVMKNQGFTFEFYDRTNLNLPKGRAIDLFIKIHPEITDYAILDDEEVDLIPQQLPYLFQTSAGITEQITDKLERYFNN